MAEWEYKLEFISVSNLESLELAMEKMNELGNDEWDLFSTMPLPLNPEWPEFQFRRSFAERMPSLLRQRTT